jgi:hypothetical protein
MRGVVLWPDFAAASAIQRLWETLESNGTPTLLSHTHGGHRPHLSLFVAEELPTDETLAALHPVPTDPIPLHLENAGIFPQGVLFLSCTPSVLMLDEQARVCEVARPLSTGAWPFYEIGRWIPHVTVSMSLTPEDAARALSIIADALPIHGTLDRGGVEDGTTGDHWTVE